MQGLIEKSLHGLINGSQDPLDDLLAQVAKRIFEDAFNESARELPQLGN